MRTPKEIVEYVNKSAVDRMKTPVAKLVLLGFLGGVYISMGALLSVIIGYGFPSLASQNPSIIKLLMGVSFPVGLIMIVLSGGELFTGCCAYFIPNVMVGRQRWQEVVRYCSIVWVTNFVGALFFAYFLVYLPHLSNSVTTLEGFLSIAQVKSSNPFFVTLLKGVGANWLVCLAVWLGISSKGVVGKILGIWFPVMTFVAIGYEHSVANMFFLPVAMLEGFELSLMELFTVNLIPATIGNIIGGALFVGASYGYLYNEE